jgi:hypothetical protein
VAPGPGDDPIAKAQHVSAHIHISDPRAAKRYRRYQRPGLSGELPLLFLQAKKMNPPENK